jgi:glycogen synthase
MKSMKNQNLLLFEISSEVCLKMGGIHTVISTKIPYIQERWGDDYYMIGAYIPGLDYSPVFEKSAGDDTVNPAVQKAVSVLRERNMNVYTGTWKISGNPKVILFDAFTLPGDVEEYKKAFLSRHGISAPPDKYPLPLYLQFGYCVEAFFKALSGQVTEDEKIIAHFHEYMTTVSLPAINDMGVRTVYTTHATVVGRNFAGMYKSFHASIPEIKWEMAYGMMSRQHRFSTDLERMAARHCHVFTAVSEITARECAQFLGRRPDVITPNGLNVEEIWEQAQAGTNQPRQEIREVAEKQYAAGHLHKAGETYYFFTSGRYEYINKGYDLVVRALSRLNKWLSANKIDVSIVMFFITDEPYTEYKTKRERIIKTYLSRIRPRAKRLFPYAVPLYFEESRLVKDLRRFGLRNRKSDRVKIFYQPQFLSKEGAIKMDYLDFVRGCDLGIFPSYYEPWGYTPAECISAGTPTVTTNVSGFGDYILNTGKDKRSGVFVIDRKAADPSVELFEVLKKFVLEPRNYKEKLREVSELCDWDNMMGAYMLAYEKAVGEERSARLHEKVLDTAFS